MADIRPTGPGTAGPPQTSRPASAARTAAQRAFFQNALGAPAPTPAPVPARQPAVQAAASPQPATQAAQTEAPQRYLRPGSLLDIKV